MRSSETLNELAAALSMAQAEMPAAKFNATNPFLKNKYADLGSVIEASRPVLAKHGLSVSQLVVGESGEIGVETVLLHKSGQWISSFVLMPAGEEKGKSDAQVAGSNISYLRRYALTTILNMYADEDTDGNKPQSGQRKPAATGKPPMTLEEAKNVTNSEGKKYGDLDTTTLAGMANSISRVQNQTAEHEKKLLAIQIILDDRNSGK